MNYLIWFWLFFQLDKNGDTYKPWASKVCQTIFPCHSYWAENHLGKPANDNSKV